MNQFLLIFAFIYLLIRSSAAQSANSWQPQPGQTMKALGVVPDVIDVEPTSLITIKYDSGVTVSAGNELTPTQVQNEPIQVEWPVEEGAYYTLCVTAPDVDPSIREFQHWLVVNIPGHEVKKGEVISVYVGSGPPEGDGLHRYVFLVYKQPGLLTVDETRSPTKSGKHRLKFSMRKFAEKYQLGQPVAANAFLAKWDDYVPELYKELFQ